MTKTCKHCGTALFRPSKQAIERFEERQFCNRKCYGAAKTAARSTGRILDEAELDRFMQKVSPEPNSGCWLWVGPLRDGYGIVTLRGKVRQAHRTAYRHFKCEIPNGLQLDHLCRVRCCVNPDHLEPVTQQINIKRGLTGTNLIAIAKKIQQSPTCANGHTYTPENTYYRPSGARRCRTCTLQFNKLSSVRRSA